MVASAGQSAVRSCEFASLGGDREVNVEPVSYLGHKVSHVLYLLNMCSVNNLIFMVLISFFKDDTYPKLRSSCKF